jgi:thiamine pyrophosphate-dependent acetolactate synthase large subunit-like protein
MNGFDLVARCLKAEGVTWMACFPANPLIEAAAKVDIRPIVFRQERGGINAVDGYARQTAGKQIGIFCSQDGPGAENSFGGIAQAWGDSVPILFLPQGAGTGASDVSPNFSAASNYRDITKLALSIDTPPRIVKQMQRAFHAVRQGRPGPVLVEMQRDALGQDVPDDAAGSYCVSRPMRSAPSRRDVTDAVKALLAASNPVIWAGQGVLYAQASDLLMELVELTGIPVVTSMQGKSAFPDRHPLALGSANRTAPKTVWKWLGESDTVFAIGTGLTRTSFGIDMPPGKFLIHSTINADDINKDYTVDLGLVGDARLTLELMIDEVKAAIGERGREANQGTVQQIAATKAEWLAEWAPILNSDEVPVNPYRVVNEINKHVDHAQTVMTHDAGNPRDQIMPFYEATVPHGYIGWGKTTHLGYGIPLAIGAKIADPSKFCMNLMGDLAFGHTGMEIETAVRAETPITTVVINNLTMGGYDSKMPTAMAKFGAGNQSGDYAGVATALGARGIHVTTGDEIGPAIRDAQAANANGETVVIEVRTRQDTRFSIYNDYID